MRKLTAMVALVLVAAASCVAGVGLGLLWQGWSRTDTWDAAALQATFNSAFLEGQGDKRSPVFYYRVENRTRRDYSIKAASDIQLFVKDAGTLDNTWGDAIVVDLPVFIPAGDKANVTLRFRMLEGGPSSDSREDEQLFLRDKARSWNAYEAFVLLDSSSRYRIEFPIGTRDGSK